MVCKCWTVPRCSKLAPPPDLLFDVHREQEHQEEEQEEEEEQVDEQVGQVCCFYSGTQKNSFTWGLLDKTQVRGYT